MNALRVFLGGLIAVPCSIFLWYTVLSSIHPDRMVWFAFYVYIPVQIIGSIISVSADREYMNKKWAEFIKAKAGAQ